MSVTTGKKYNSPKGNWKNHLQPITNKYCKELGLGIIPAEYSKKPKNISRDKWEKEMSMKEIEDLQNKWIKQFNIEQPRYYYPKNDHYYRFIEECRMKDPTTGEWYDAIIYVNDMTDKPKRIQKEMARVSKELEINIELKENSDYARTKRQELTEQREYLLLHLIYLASNSFGNLDDCVKMADITES